MLSLTHVVFYSISPSITACSLGSDNAFDFHVSIVFLDLKHFHDIDIFIIYISPTFYQVKCKSLILCLSDISSWWNSGFIFLDEILHCWHGLLTVAHLVSRDVRVLDESFNLLSWSTCCQFLHCVNSMFSPLQVINCLWRDILILWQYPVPRQNFTLDWTSIEDFCLIQSLSQ